MDHIPFPKYDPQNTGPQYLEDIATGYWFSFALFTAVEEGLFSLLEPGGKTAEEVSAALGFAPEGTERFLTALCRMGLAVRHGSLYLNSKIASDYLVEGKDNYQGEAILWRRDLLSHWAGLKDCLGNGGKCDEHVLLDPAALSQRRRKYINAMDAAAKIKVSEILKFLEGLSLEGRLLDVGAGSGAVAAGFLEHYPSLKAVLLDLPEILDYSRGFIDGRGLGSRVDFRATDILASWPVEKECFDIVVLSNIIHAYSDKELHHILGEAKACLNQEGILLIHDFFFEHFPEKAALFDLNMFINTYNGRVFPAKRVREELTGMDLHVSELITLASDTALLFASKTEGTLGRLRIDMKDRLSAKIKSIGFRNVLTIPVGTIHVPGWTDMRCRFGCGHFGRPCCPPHGPGPEKTIALMKDYTHALLLEGEPPTGEFQRRVLQAEREAFNAGYYKAFSYWAGPCSLCSPCPEDGICRNTKDSRPSMEGAGIDVFETVRREGLSISTINKKDDFVKYFGLVLLE